jgi:hypothetical protein
MAGASQVQLLTAEGELEEGPLTRFLAENGAEHWNRRYRVVAVMGPQSSGKSTLMNHVFGTSFREMDHERGRSRTTRGVWFARATDPASASASSTDLKRTPKPTLVMDLEGTDGRERGEDDTAFEKQTALFAMATADVLMVNMWCTDLGREVASGKPLLKVVFQVNLKLFPGAEKRTTLLFVIRDKSRTPEEKLRETLHEDLTRIWEGVQKPERHARLGFDAFFDVRFVALSHYEHARSAFLDECREVRERFFPSEDSTESNFNTSTGSIPASGLVVSFRETWRAVRENRDLDLPARGVMVATVRCEEIAEERLGEFAAEKAQEGLVRLANRSDPDVPVCGLGSAIRDVFEAHLASYDEESKFFDEDVRASKRAFLRSRMTRRVAPAVAARMTRVAERRLAHLEDALASVLSNDSRTKTTTTKTSKTSSSLGVGSGSVSAVRGEIGSGFASIRDRAVAEARAFWRAAAEDAGRPPRVTDDRSVEDADPNADANADTEDATVAAFSAAELAFEKAMDASAREARADGIAAATSRAERVMERAVGAAVTSALDACPVDLWDRVNRSVASHASNHAARLEEVLVEFALSPAESRAAGVSAFEKTRDAADSKLRDAASASNVVALMKRAFARKFSKDSRGLPRTWRASDDVASANATAQREAARVLAAVAISRLAPAAAFGEDGSGFDSAACEKAEASRAFLERAFVDAFAPPVDEVESDSPPEPEAASRGEALAAEKNPYPSEWPDVEPPDEVLLDPGECREAWRAFENDIAYAVSQAMAARAAAERGGQPNAPGGMYLALALAGMNEAFWLLRNPVSCLFLVLLFVFLRAVVRKLDVETAMRMGLVPGIVFLATRIVPAAAQVFSRLLEEGGDARGISRGAAKKNEGEETPGHGSEADATRAFARGVRADGTRRRGGNATMNANRSP